MSSINFSLKAEKVKKKEQTDPQQWRIREYFTFSRAAGSNGELAFATEGYVDDDVRKENAKEYAEFVKFVEENQDRVYAEAKAAYKE